MRISYDPKSDALSIIFRETTATIRELAESVTPVENPLPAGTEGA